MAFRKIHDTFWTDPDIEDLTPEQKFFYLYLITNPLYRKKKKKKKKKKKRKRQRRKFNLQRRLFWS
jgi:hypothetical protein